jgi:hypothetical protein
MRRRLGSFHRFGFRHFGSGFDRRRFRGAGCGVTRAIAASQAAAHFERDIVIERTRVSLLLSDTELRQEVQDHVRLDLQLARQLVNADFTHTIMSRSALLAPELL